MKQVICVLRTIKLGLEKRVGMIIPQTHPLLGWMVAYAAWMLTVRVVGSDVKIAFERTRHRPFVKRLVLKIQDRLAGGALDSRTKLGVVLGYRTHSNSYQVFVDGQPKLYRSIYRLSMSARWSTEKLQEVSVTFKDQHNPRGARAVPLIDRGEGPEKQIQGRAPRRLELRQSDFDPAMGGFGWTEHCTKCTKARLYGWRQASSAMHSDACRRRIE